MDKNSVERLGRMLKSRDPAELYADSMYFAEAAFQSNKNIKLRRIQQENFRRLIQQMSADILSWSNRLKLIVKNCDFMQDMLDKFEDKEEEEIAARAASDLTKELSQEYKKMKTGQLLYEAAGSYVNIRHHAKSLSSNIKAVNNVEPMLRSETQARLILLNIRQSLTVIIMFARKAIITLEMYNKRLLKFLRSSRAKRLGL